MQIVIILLVLLLDPASSLATESDVLVEQNIAQDEIHRHPIELPADHYLVMTIKQLDANIAVALIAPNGERLIEMDYRRGRFGTEPLDWVTPMAGRHWLEVRALNVGTSGRYRARIAELRPASADDVLRVKAERDYLLGNLAQQDRTPEKQQDNLNRALALQQKSYELFHQIDDAVGQAKTLHRIGGIYDRQSRFDEALKAYSRAVDAWPYARGGRIDSLKQMGFVSLRQDRPAEAVKIFARARILAREIEDLALEAEFLFHLGSAHHHGFNSEEALAHYRQALDISTRHQLQKQQFETLIKMTEAFNDYEQLQQAVDHASEAWRIIRSLSPETAATTSWQYSRGVVLNLLGTLYQKIGHHDQALFFLRRALEMSRKQNHRVGMARILTNIGWTQHFSGDPAAAILSFEEALALQQDIGDEPTQAAIRTNLSRSLQDLGRFQEALHQAEKSLEISQRRQTSLPLARAQLEIAKTHLALRQPEQALAWKEKFKEADVNAPSLSEAFTSVHARALRQLGRLEEALPLAEKAVASFESRRAAVSVNQRAEYMAQRRSVFEMQIDLLMDIEAQQPDRGFAERALETSERARARSLIDWFETSIDPSVRTDSKLAERKEALQRRINALELRRLKARSEKAEAETLESINQELQTALIDYQNLLSTIYRQDPRLRDLTEPELPTAREIKASLDPETLILHFLLGKERSYLWLVSSQKIESFILPPRQHIEQLARRAYSALTARETWPEGELLEQRTTRIRDQDLAFTQIARELSDILLAPVGERMRNKRLMIVGDGALHYLPFSALPTPDEDGTVMVQRHEIVHLPSVATLQALRREASQKAPADELLFVLADPVFAEDDQRAKPKSLTTSSRATENGQEDATRTVLDLELDPSRFQRLRFSRSEARSIADLVEDQSATLLLDFEASRQSLEQENLKRFRILHFATHGVLNSRHPELSALVLSLVNEQGKPEDGFLRLHEIYDLDLNADLVVLSACQTALGRQILGEGLIGLTRGFMYAGAARVMASLWTAQDRATKELMTEFYRAMLERGKKPATALRSAQRTLLQRSRYQAPYYWAAFVLQGDWR